LKNDLDELREIGLEKDGGIYRLAFSKADMQARAWLKEKLKKASVVSYKDGAEISSGINLHQITTEDFEETKKMVLLK